MWDPEDRARRDEINRLDRQIAAFTLALTMRPEHWAILRLLSSRAAFGGTRKLSRATIARQLGTLARTTYKRHMIQLRGLGLVAVRDVRGGQNNGYWITPSGRRTLAAHERNLKGLSTDERTE